MRRSQIGVAAALPAFLIGVTVTMLNHRPAPHEPESTASRSPFDKGGLEFRLGFAEVFRGFDFVGSALYRTEREACPYELNESRPLPEVFEEGRMYVFHSRDHAYRDTQFDTLQERFKSLGVETSVSGSFFSGNRPHPDMLLFQGRGYVGNITGRAHCTMSKGRGQSPSSEVSDYVLTLVKAH